MFGYKVHSFHEIHTINDHSQRLMQKGPNCFFNQ